jgi:hypothetical protein
VPEAIEIHGLDELLKALEAMPERVLPLAEGAMSKSCAAIVGEVKPYPSATAANQPGRIDADGQPLGYYERGRGWWYPVKQVATMKGLRLKSEGVKLLGKRTSAGLGIVGYKLRAVSEQLGRKWAWVVARITGGVEGRVGNNASYAGTVQGYSTGEPMQSQRMAAIGWTALDAAIDRAGPAIDAAWKEALDKLPDVWVR